MNLPLVADQPIYALAAAAVAVLVALLLAWRALRGQRAENVLTVVAALIATSVQADGMWVFFRDVLDAPVFLRIECFAFIEVAIFVSGLRARRNIKETEDHTAGVDGVAVWVLAALSAVLASTATDSLRSALLRLTAPAVAAWLWERGLAGERRRARKTGGRGGRISWRLTPERVLVRLGIAETSGRTASEVDAHRRLTRVALAAQRLRGLRIAQAGRWRTWRAERRLDAAMRGAVEYARVADDQDRQEELVAQLGALHHARSLAELTPPAPWAWAVDPGGVATADTLGEPLLIGVEGVRSAQPLDDEPFGDLPAGLLAWFTGDERPVPAVPGGVPDARTRAAQVFADEVRAGRVPGIRAIKRRLRVGQEKAAEVQAYLADLADAPDVPLDASSLVSGEMGR